MSHHATDATERPVTRADIVLMRAGHYFDAGNGACHGATISRVFEDGEVNLSVLDWSGNGYGRSRVRVVAVPAKKDRRNSFHLTTDCPWGR